MFIILTMSWGCADNQKNLSAGSGSMVHKNTMAKKSESRVPQVSLQSISNQPCIEIQSFVVDMEKMNWVSDTNRLLKTSLYKMLDRNQVHYFNERPFYKITFQDSQLGDFFRIRGRKPKLELDSIAFEHSDFAVDSVDFELFKKTKTIWGYFYKNRNATDLISDGVIEQWEFSTGKEAAEALKKIRKASFDIYFNTNPYFCVIENKLIVFHTRAMRFSYDQKPVFEKFLEEKVNKNIVNK